MGHSTLLTQEELQNLADAAIAEHETLVAAEQKPISSVESDLMYLLTRNPGGMGEASVAHLQQYAAVVLAELRAERRIGQRIETLNDILLKKLRETV